MLKLVENHVKTQLCFCFLFLFFILFCFVGFFQIFNLGNFFYYFDYDGKKHDFFSKRHFFGIFWSKFSKILPQIKNWKKKKQNKTIQNKKQTKKHS